jgi:hypothetical protein
VFSQSDAIKDAPIPDVHIDVTLTENHNFESEVTDNPVEEGVVISDHIDLKPESLTITGVISDTPLNFTTSIQGAATTAGAFVGKKIVGPLGAVAGVGAGAVAGLLVSPNNRMKNTFDHFRDLQSKRVPFTVITGLKRYTNMVIVTLTVNRDSKSGRSFNFTATLKQIRIVESKTIKIKNTFASTPAGSKQDLGKKSSIEAEKDNRTLTATTFDFVKKKVFGSTVGGG